MKSVTYHIVLENPDFWEYSEKHRFGREDLPTLSFDSEIFDEMWEIKRMWHVPCESTLSATSRLDEAAHAYGIPVEKLHVYSKTIEMRKIS